MLKAISGRDESRHSELMNEIFRFRHRHFVDGLGWEALRKPDGRERDAYDTQAAIHLPFIHEGCLVGYSRLLSTSHPHLLSHAYPELTGGDTYPVGPSVFEWTRCAADTLSSGAYGRISNALMTAILEYVLLAGIERLIVETDPTIVTMLSWMGYGVHHLFPPAEFAGRRLIIAEVAPSWKAYDRHSRIYGIDHSLVDPDCYWPLAKRMQRPDHINSKSTERIVGDFPSYSKVADRETETAF